LTACLLLPGLALAKEARLANNVSELEATEMLAQEPRTTFLVDVRTREQYMLQGHPPQAYNVPWRFLTQDFQVRDGAYAGDKAAYTGYQLAREPNPDFIGVLQSLFKLEDRLIVLSNDGEDGAEAADAMVKEGFKRVCHVRNGFLGDRLAANDNDKLAEKLSPYWQQRGRVNGWVYWGLPVSHVIDPKYVYPPDLKRMQTQK
jgi:rhodanese-related sulfurtransferase